MNDFEDTLVRAIKLFISDVEKSGEEFITVSIDRESRDYTVDIGTAGILNYPLDKPLSSEDVGADFVIAVLASAVDDKIGIEVSIKSTARDVSVFSVKYKPECLAH